MNEWIRLLRRLDRIVYVRVIWWFFLGGRKRSLARVRDFEKHGTALARCECGGDLTGAHRGDCKVWSDPQVKALQQAVVSPRAALAMSDLMKEHYTPVQEAVFNDWALNSAPGAVIDIRPGDGILHIRLPDGKVKVVSRQAWEDPKLRKRMISDPMWTF